MNTSRWVVLASLLAASLVSQPASATYIAMPPGSTVWMKVNSNVPPGDLVGSNLPGPNPPNGIPLTTFGSLASSFATVSAEILPDHVRTFLRANTGTFMYSSFQDTYTVGGTAVGSFPITFHLHSTGTARSIPFAQSSNIMLGSNAKVVIGTFSPISGDAANPFLEQFRVNAFDPSTTKTQILPFATAPAPFSVPVDVATSYTRMVSVGDVFDIGYGVDSVVSQGEIDLLNTATISFDLPEGLFLTSALAQTLVPEPSAFSLSVFAVLGLAALGIRRGISVRFER